MTQRTERARLGTCAPRSEAGEHAVDPGPRSEVVKALGLLERGFQQPNDAGPFPKKGLRSDDDGAVT